MAEKLTLTVGNTQDGRLLAIISTGGHPQLNRETCHVLTLEVIERREDAQPWFERMKAERPWETRQ